MTASALDSARTRLALRLRQVRLQRGTSVRQLAEAAGFSPSFISQIETGQASPSIASLQRIADILEVGIADLFVDAQVEPMVVRRQMRGRLDSEWSRARLESLARRADGAPFDAMVVTLRAGGRSGKTLHTQPRAQFGFVVEGRVRLVFEASVVDLERGDSVCIPADAGHRWENSDTIDAQILIAVDPGKQVIR